MKQNNIFLLLLLAFLIFCKTEAYSRKFLKIENCTSSGRHTIVEECFLKDNKFNFVFRFVNGTNVAIVSLINYFTNLTSKFEFYNLKILSKIT